MAGRIVFLEDYDMTMARYMTSGSDVWLNTPRRPLEASGTSGMKAGMNGVLNCSVLDGWWAEGYYARMRLGHRQGRGVRGYRAAGRDRVQGAVRSARAGDRPDLLRARPRRPAPRLDQDDEDVDPRRRQAISRFHRTLMEYTDRYYLPALENARQLKSRGYERRQGGGGLPGLARQGMA